MIGIFNTIRKLMIKIRIKNKSNLGEAKPKDPNDPMERIYLRIYHWIEEQEIEPGKHFYASLHYFGAGPEPNYYNILFEVLSYPENVTERFGGVHYAFKARCEAYDIPESGQIYEFSMSYGFVRTGEQFTWISGEVWKNDHRGYQWHLDRFID